ncbi:MAG: hypothetical protein Unbinned1473contig1000_61 [Prokaryotic dsDNA virus sp.]|nr:MAG: hypothetical protein Unbinned1473contig1000_61 [Prokaryotic dsDNA virus sp.]|tara:strand:- start:3463 stop:4224 length:762 start_codon:yes stop_codon:yes gene_type:complete
MAKISTYDFSSPTSEDYVIGTKSDNLSSTKNFKVGQIMTLLTLDIVLQNGNQSDRAVTLGGNLTLDGNLTDGGGSVGSNGQLLSSTGTGVQWIDQPSSGGSLTDVLTGTSADSLQVPSGLDTPLQVTFGAAQGTIVNDVMIDAAGTVTFNQAGQYHVFVELSTAKQSAGAITYIVVRGLLSSTEIDYPDVIGLTTEEFFPYKKKFIVDATASQTFQIQLMRDSNGSNDGYLSRFAGSGGFGITPSAFIKIWKA